MHSMQDMVYNWLSIQTVASKRPEDKAAQETRDFFEEMLEEKYQINEMQVSKKEEMYLVHCQTITGAREFRFPIELIDCMNDTIQEEPHKFPNYE
ncbi:hypothetical protein GLW08_02275 [Pontibacillus yanchengensis]|uniref:Uncharacterized protein n=2 Tax=Pontibacillus yanchengensis TaxID=462910 RepID=A0ACC7VBV7_9BACI|nr:hypothetical protein [Pontibacillus yanchengensis]MYL32990.1 hypothetical protein [Pontibacillus yanchengensis]MYL52160.1 hypothetical protein [Pontibacillus yanchengensis]